jgi:alkylhydroperoxidase family enzyme
LTGYLQRSTVPYGDFFRWLRSRSVFVLVATIAGPVRGAPDAPGSWPLSSNDEAWKFLPETLTGGGARLLTWVRATARDLPRTTVAMLNLDRLHRTKSPLGPSLRGKMQWVAADANQCEYARATAEGDLRRAGVTEAEIADLKAGRWSNGERDALNFASQMTVNASLVTDDQVATLTAAYGEAKLAAMVLLLALANFQDQAK